MKGICIIVLTLLITLPSWNHRTEQMAEQPASERLAITTPQDDSRVEHRTIVSGRVVNPTAIVWVVVRPLRSTSYWVQPPVDVNTEDGTWSVKIYVGHSEHENNGEEFQIMAVANTAAPLKEGDILKEWPKAQWSSRIIEVTKY